MGNYYDEVAVLAHSSRNQMVYACLTAVTLGAIMYSAQSLWLSLPILVTVVWYRTYEEAYRYYSGIKQRLDREAAKVEQQ
jgi:hypothetical protein